MVNDDAFKIPPTGDRYAHTTECTLEHPFQFAAMLGHMHEWGKSITVERIALHDDGADRGIS